MREQSLRADIAGIGTFDTIREFRLVDSLLEAFGDKELSAMLFKKGDKVRTDDGYMGEILFIDNDGIEAQVALEQVTVRLRTDTLRTFDEYDTVAADLDKARSKQPASKVKRATRVARK